MTREQGQNYWIAGVFIAMGLLWSLAVWVNFNESLTLEVDKFTEVSFFFSFGLLVIGLVSIYSGICFGRYGSLKTFARVAGWFLFFAAFLLLGVLAAVVSNPWILHLALPLAFVAGWVIYLFVVRRFAGWRGYRRPQTSEVVSIGAILIFSLLIWNLSNQVVKLYLPPPTSFSSSPYYVFVRLIIPIIIANRIYRWTTQAIWKEDSKQAQESFRLRGYRSPESDGVGDP